MIIKKKFEIRSENYKNREWQPLNSHECPRQNFSIPYQYNIKQTRDENKIDCLLIPYHILWTNMIRIVWQTVRTVTIKI